MGVWSQGGESQTNFMEPAYESTGYHQPHISEPSPLESEQTMPRVREEEASAYQSVGRGHGEKEGRFLKMNKRKKQKGG